MDIATGERDGAGRTGRVMSLDVTLRCACRFSAFSRRSAALHRQPTTRRGARETVILTDGYWRARSAGDPRVIGRRILLDGRARDIIGVLPRPFRFLDQKHCVAPADAARSQQDRSSASSASARMARLKPGVTIRAGERRHRAHDPASRCERFPAIPGLQREDVRGGAAGAASRSPSKSLIGDVSTVLWVLMGTVGIVLLIACANVANLLLVRAEGRQQELAIRAALGAGRAQSRASCWSKASLLGVLGGVLGLGLAYGGVRLLIALAPANLPRLDRDFDRWRRAALHPRRSR